MLGNMWIFSISTLVVSVAAIADLDCTSNGAYTEQATICENSYSGATCALSYPDSAVTPGGSQERPVQCFNGTNGPSEDIKTMAIANCPKTCGFCCKTPAYNCQNVPNPRLLCSTITRSMCQNPSWKAVITEDCPAACGFCQEGGCVDMASDCAIQPLICRTTEMDEFVTKNCQRTCGLCALTAKNSTAPCLDASTSCQSWKKNGFCTNSFYSTADKMKYCAKTCGLCGSTPTCGDASSSCPSWVKNGFCNNSHYSPADKKKYCAKSCGLC